MTPEQRKEYEREMKERRRKKETGAETAKRREMDRLSKKANRLKETEEQADKREKKILKPWKTREKRRLEMKLQKGGKRPGKAKMSRD